MALHVLASARAGLESTRGTAVTPTRLLYFKPGGATHAQEVGTLIPEEAWASYTPNRRAYAGLERNRLTFEGDLTYTDAIWPMNLAVDAEASGSVTDTSAYTWTGLPVHTSDALKSATVEFAYADLLSTVGWRLPGCLGNSWEITFTKPASGGDTGVSHKLELITASPATQITSFGGSLSDRTLVSATGNQIKSYINGTGSAFGTTADTRVNQATFRVNNDYRFRDGFDGTGNAIELVRGAKRGSRLTMQRYFNDKTELDAYIAKTSRRIRIIAEGAVIGAATAKYTVQLDFGGVADVHASADSDGMVYANIEYAPLNDSAISSDFKLTFINLEASIT